MTTTAERALEYKRTFERGGEPVAEIVVEGRKIRIIFQKDDSDEAPGLNKKWSTE